MKAITNSKYGTPDVMELSEVDKPVPMKNEVLVKVIAVSVNKADWFMLNGTPFPVRLMAGLTKPKTQILGADVAGIVEIIGDEVTQFQTGDEVYGDLSGCGFGGFAEYVAADEKFLTKKPSNISFEESAALPLAAITALQGLRDRGKIKQKENVLINGASGGVGVFAIQIAKAFGGNVTAVCSTSKMKQASEFGADNVIDYTEENFTEQNKKYDLIFDIVGNHPLSKIKKLLTKNGRFVACAFIPKLFFYGPITALTSKKKMVPLMAQANREDMLLITKLVEENKLKPSISKTFTLQEVPEAMRTIGGGSVAGKLVITP